MVIIMNMEATQEQIRKVIDKVEAIGFTPHPIQGSERAVIAVIGDSPILEQDKFTYLPGVDRVMPISRPFKIASRELVPDSAANVLSHTGLGGNDLLIIAGPCAVESRTQLLETAQAVREAGAHALRGGAFKPRTSPYAFQGLAEKGLEILAEARELTGLPVVTEVMTPEKVKVAAEYADVLQIGARNMQNFDLLHAVGEIQHPVLLKRGMSSSINELLMSAEHILSHGNYNVILCERGIRTFETATRNTTDINAVPVLKSLTHLPVIVDPSHSTGHWEYVTAVARAAIAAGADGLIVEVHLNPEEALSDGGQSLKPERFAELVRQVRAIGEVLGRTVPPSPAAFALSAQQLNMAQPAWAG
jgi:3-deoxy-7-phosphoheptulonate synthase